MRPIILASTSPRRKELMEKLPWAFEIKTKQVVETINPELSPEENVKALAYKKAEAVAKTEPMSWVIGADTVVCYKGKILGKPDNEQQAQAMLSELNGNWHEVITGVAIIQEKKEICQVFYVRTKVKMATMTAQEIADYVASKEPMDKAGSYGIQGLGSRYIEGIEGDYFNVVGLPVSRLYQQLKQLLLTQTL